MRLRINFTKTEAMRFTSHLDLHRAWERTFRRAGLNLVFSQGFNPRPKFQIAAALPLGFTSQCELLDVWLKDETDSIDQIKERLIASAPPGIQIIKVQEVDESETALQNRVSAIEYLIESSQVPPNIETLIKEMRAADALPRQWKGKTYDLKPLIEQIEVLPEGEKGVKRLRLRLKAQKRQTGRPEEVLAALGISIQDARIQRTALFLS